MSKTFLRFRRLSYDFDNFLKISTTFLHFLRLSDVSDILDDFLTFPKTFLRFRRLSNVSEVRRDLFDFCDFRTSRETPVMKTYGGLRRRFLLGTVCLASTNLNM